ncbi:circadian clock protein KaiB [Rhodospirillum rubrum]|uniref:circadian clock KaiB family protein n=1 Tax=Rhodospirillum rubrum TaxID=1085 RepID=UPI001908591D|nr:circadian clock KaiB family protein [Rhodospirillum rubrum]MBK1665287.1 circadian clock protein KaiB [Rhodospirillum rubrum]MBK1677137.1 circadian clock protein KaiB [Rhodospirillum rubrum]
MGPIVHLTLYICGETLRSRNALHSVERIRHAYGPGCAIRVVDVIDNPVEAEEQRILATPTLVRDLPQPRRRVVGDLIDVDQVCRILDLPLPPSSPENADRTP